MKIVINQLEQIAGVEIYPIISLLIFFTFFILVTYLVMKTGKQEIDEISNMPLDGNNDIQEGIINKIDKNKLWIQKIKPILTMKGMK